MNNTILIIGNGVAGATAARSLRKLDPTVSIHMVSSETEFFFSRTALMYVYMGQMEFENTKPYEDDFWRKNRIQLHFEHVESLLLDQRKANLRSGKQLHWDYLILATGSKSVFHNWPGQSLKGVQGLYSKPDLDLMTSQTQNIKSAVVVGAGLIGVELAEMLHSRGIHVTFLVKDEWFWGNVLPCKEGLMVNRHLQHRGIILQLNTRLKSLAGSNGRVEKAIAEDGREFDAEFVGIATGVSPNVDFLRNSGIEINKGILVNQKLQTNVSNVYAIGDCAELRQPLPHRKSIEAVWYTARMMGEVVADSIIYGDAEYLPGVWFNSAKFFDLEFQTYGSVSPRPTQNVNSFYWENEKEERLIHLQFDSESCQLLGVNSLGIRLRHEIMDKWLNDKVSVQYAVQNFEKAVFDKEFSRKFTSQLKNNFINDVNLNISSRDKC